MKCFKILFILITLFAAKNISPQTSFDNAVDFDGSGDYANTFNSPYLPTPNGTIEAWVKVRSILPPGGNDGEAFLAKNEEQWNLGDFYVFFDYSSGKLKSRIQTSPSIEIDVQSNNSFGSSSDEWFHYAFTWGSNGMKMYINGLLQTNQNNLTYSALNNIYNIYVGAHGYMLHNGTYVVSDFFDGQIDELRFWNYQKNSQQILALKDAPLDSAYYTTIDSGLVGYWKFDELEDLGINNDGVDDVRDFSVLHNHIDLAGDAHLVGSNVPVELTSFSGKGTNHGVLLEWITATELNNYGFEIEKALGQTEFHTIAFIKGLGTTTETRKYSYLDNIDYNGTETYSYRLKQIDYNGRFSYSEIITVKFDVPKNYMLEQNYPNPFNPTTTIRYAVPVSDKVSIKIYDISGQLIAVLVNEVKEAGTYEINFNTEGLASGIYFYQMNAGDFFAVKKMSLLK